MRSRGAELGRTIRLARVILAQEANRNCGSGTVSNRNRSRGSCCIAERRMLETLDTGTPKTDFMAFGDRVRIEMLDAAGSSVFGAIDQEVCPSP